MCNTTEEKNICQQRQPVVRENIHELLEVGIIKRIDYSVWLANLVVVPKHNGEWRMCIDYTDLNKTISKKPFLLPCIDQVVDTVVGHEVLCFLDADKGYHQ